uniref:Uncharacterized protein n=1 Tax=Craspedostauros australis TaxID=1486917 RepID=A0A7R9ZR92_9STRA|mmetsp:Transcript_6828/g.18556  ORF Transcript_6828/g.18556 Transcript_6828/m.18556 type:complete len:111 (+) Transcript_6828:54-386(+)
MVRSRALAPICDRVVAPSAFCCPRRGVTSRDIDGEVGEVWQRRRRCTLVRIAESASLLSLGEFAGFCPRGPPLPLFSFHPRELCTWAILKSTFIVRTMSSSILFSGRNLT